VYTPRYKRNYSQPNLTPSYDHPNFDPTYHEPEPTGVLPESARPAVNM